MGCFDQHIAQFGVAVHKGVGPDAAAGDAEAEAVAQIGTQAGEQIH